VVADLVPMPAAPADLLRVNRVHAFEESGRRMLFVVENAAFCALDDASWSLAGAIAGKERTNKSELLASVAREHGEEEAKAAILAFEQLHVLEPFDRPRFVPDRIARAMQPLASLVLHVSHDCNLRCGYCYADYGRYGGDPGIMTEEVAVAHARAFFDQLASNESVGVTFFGGEPLMNMPVVFAAHRYMKERAERERRRVSFSLTTNGTLLTHELVEFFARERFTITVSIDGPPDVHDRLRPLEEGGGSYARIMERVKGTGLDAVARVTLTHRSTDVARIVRHLVDAGFREVGVSPVATGSDRFDLSDADLAKVLGGMRLLADDFVEWAKEGRVFPFSNIKALLEQIGAGEPRAIPCGAGVRLAAADNKGDLYACHRLVGEPAFKIGDLSSGVNPEARAKLIGAFHPRTREPCAACWARYLCGGGCHHIAWLHSKKGEAPWTIADGFCDFLRAWYKLGLYTYARLSDEAPEVLGRLGQERTACSQPSGL
jgi:uncharacterized protein